MYLFQPLYLPDRYRCQATFVEPDEVQPHATALSLPREAYAGKVAQDAYGIVTRLEPFFEEKSQEVNRTLLPARTVPPALAGLRAYWPSESRFIFPDEVQPYRTAVALPDRVQYVRPATSAYDVRALSADLLVGAVSESPELRKAVLPELAFAFRVALIAYQLALATFAVQSEPPTLRHALPERAAPAPRTSASTYVVSLRPTVPDEPHLQKQLLPDRAPGLRAGQTAYVVSLLPTNFFISFAGELPSVEARRIEVPDRAPGPGRAALAAYQNVTPPQVAETTPPPGVRRETPTRQVVYALRAAATAYQVRTATFNPDEANPAAGAVREVVAAFQPGPAHAARSAYWLPPRATYLEDEPHTQVRLLPERAPAALRGEYRIVSAFVQPDLASFAGRLLPEQAPAAGRAGPSAYTLAVSFAVPSEPPLGRHALPDRAPPAPRAAQDAYGRVGTFAVQPEPPLLAIAAPAQAWAAGRAGATAYQVAATFAVQPEPATSERAILPDVARDAGRAARTAYNPTATFAVQPEPPLGRHALPVHASPAARASGAAYVVGLAPQVAEDPLPAGERTSFTIHQSPPRRAAASAYVVAATFPVENEGPVERHRFPDRAEGPRRASWTAYVIGLSPQIAEPTLPPGWTNALAESMPRQPGRAAFTAYFISRPPVDVTSTGGAFAGPFYLDVGAIYVAGLEAGNIYVAGMEEGMVGEN